MTNTTTLPSWFWIIYYTFFVMTLGISIFAVLRRKNLILSIINLIVVITVPFISFAISLGRSEGVNEFQQLIIYLNKGDLWAIYICVAYLFIFGWWLLFYKNIRQKQK